MGTRQASPATYHTCTCGESFETTNDLLAHAREEHGIVTY